MNPVILGRVAKLGMTSVKSAGILLRKSLHYRGDLYTHLMSCRACNSMKNITRTTKRFMSASAQPGATNAWGASSGAETAALFIGASTVICGGIYYLSCSKQKTPVCKEAVKLLSRCPEVGEMLGSPEIRCLLARGREKDGKHKITLLLKGKKYKYLAIVEGREDQTTGEVTIENLSIHKKTDLKHELYIYQDGKLVAELEKDGEEQEEQEEIVEVEVVEMGEEQMKQVEQMEQLQQQQEEVARAIKELKG